jgi:hypothetical protein
MHQAGREQATTYEANLDERRHPRYSGPGGLPRNGSIVVIASVAFVNQASKCALRCDASHNGVTSFLVCLSSRAHTALAATVAAPTDGHAAARATGRTAAGISHTGG